MLISKDTGGLLESDAMPPYIQFSLLDIPLEEHSIQQKQLWA